MWGRLCYIYFTDKDDDDEDDDDDQWCLPVTFVHLLD